MPAGPDRVNEREIVETADGEIVEEFIDTLERDSERPVNQGELARALRRTVRVSTTHSGPLPSAEYLRSIDRIVPGSAERILAMAEREQQHRHTMDSRQADIIEKDVDHNYDVTKRGQRYGLWISAFVIVIAAILALTGHPEIAAILAGVDLVGLAAVFVIGRLVRPGDGAAEGQDPAARSVEAGGTESDGPPAIDTSRS
ncbi:DUF2335 domain-containing protein [uncultured Nocardioides sp.]|uniref:DUF2335 domain-containing protein n=1 Tax=uncultured Nocardioides sp. TaxID=198441 RepID=UPI002626D944|nr:DUF2335 domain-containing protein [uncultured Nocardioides sp.]